MKKELALTIGLLTVGNAMAECAEPKHGSLAKYYNCKNPSQYELVSVDLQGARLDCVFTGDDNYKKLIAADLNYDDGWGKSFNCKNYECGTNVKSRCNEAWEAK